MSISISEVLARILSSFDLSTQLQNIFWIISNAQTCLFLIAYAFKRNKSIIISHLDTLVKYTAFDCDLTDLKDIYGFIYVAAAIYVLFLSAIITISIISSKRKRIVSKKEGFFLPGFLLVHMSLFFAPINSIFGFVFEKNSDELSSIWTHQSFSHEGIFTVNIILTIMNLIIAFLSSIYCFSFSYKGISSRQPSLIDFYILIIKASMLWLGIKKSLIGSSGDWVLDILLLLVEFAIINLIMTDSPYFDYRSKLIQKYFCSFNFGTILTSTIYSWIDPNSLSPLFVWVALVGISYCLMKINSTDFTGIFIENKKVLFQSISFEKISFLSDILSKEHFQLNGERSNFEKKDLLLSYLIHLHSSSCLVDKCFHKAYTGEIMPKVKGKDLERGFSKFKEETVQKFWVNEINKTKRSAWLKLAFASRILDTNLSECSMIFNYINGISIIERNIFVDLMINKLTEKIKAYYSKVSSSDDTEANIVQYIEYKNEITPFKKKIRDSIQIVIKFWEEYQKDLPKLFDLFSLAVETNKLDDELRKVWPVLKNRYPDWLVQEYPFFSAYSILVRNSETNGQDMLKEYQNKLRAIFSQTQGVDKITNLTINDQKNIILTITLERAKLGIIKEVLGDIFDSFGFNPEDLKGSKVNSLMPGYIAENHDEYLLKHLQTGRSKIMFKNQFFYIRCRDGYMVPAYIYICPSPNISKGLEYMSVLRRLKNFEECIILNSDGNIMGSTREIGKELSIEPKFYGLLKIVEFCPLFNDMNKIITTSEWIQTNIPKEQISEFQHVRIKIMSWVDANPSKASHLYIPDSEKDYSTMIEIYIKFQNDGIPLYFETMKGSTRYICRIASEKAFKAQKIRYLLMKKEQILEDAKVPISPLLPRQNTIQAEQFVQQVMSITLKSTHFDNGTLVDIPNASHPRVSAIYLSKHDNTDHTVMSIHSQDLEARQHSPLKKSMIALPKINTPKMHSRPSSIQRNPEARKSISHAFSKFADAIEEVEKSRYDMKKLSHTDDYLNSNVEDGTKFLDVNQIFINLIEMNKAEGKFNYETSVSSVSKRSKTFTKIVERRINTRPVDFKVYVFSLLSISFYLAIIVALFYFNSYSIDIFKKMNLTSSGLVASSTRLNVMMQFASTVRMVDLVRKNYIIDLVPTFRNTLLNYSSTLIKLDTELFQDLESPIQNIYSFLPYEYKNQILQKYKVQQTSSQADALYLTTHQIFSLYESGGIKITKNPLGKVGIEIDEILSSIFNDALIASENIRDLFADYIEDLMDSIQFYLQNMIIIQGILTLMVSAFFLYLSINQVNHRIKFFESILKIENKKYLPHFQKIKHFSEVSIERRQRISKAILVKRSKELGMSAKGSIEKVNRRNFDSTKINRTTFVRIVLQTIIYLGMLIANIVFWREVVRKTDKISRSNSNLLYTNKLITSYLLLMPQLTLYNNMDYTTVRNLPIQDQIKNELRFLTENQQFYFRLAEDSDIESSIMEIIQSDMCVRYSDELPREIKCYTIADGSLKYGVNQLTSYYLQYIQSTVTSYDLTAKDEIAKRKLYYQSKFYDLFRIHQYVFMIPFNELNNLLRVRSVDLSDSANNYVWITNVCYLIFAFLLAGVSILINRNIQNELYATQRMLNLIPTTIIMDTPLISRFIKEDAKIF